MVAGLVFGRVGSGCGIRLLQKRVDSGRDRIARLVEEGDDILDACLGGPLEGVPSAADDACVQQHDTSSSEEGHWI